MTAAAAVLAAAAPASPRRRRLGDLLTTVLLPPPARLLYAARITASVAASAALARQLLGSGAWAAAAVAFVGPRAGGAAGGALHAAFLRIAGTVAGVVAGLGAAAAGSVGSGFVWSALALGVWVALAGAIRASPRHAYGAAVAQFTPYLLLDVPAEDAANRALARVAENLLGVALFFAAEVALAPTFAAGAVRLALREALLAAAVAGRGALRAAGGDAGGDRVPDDAAAAAAAIGRAALAQAAALRDAADEAEWAPFACGGGAGSSSSGGLADGNAALLATTRAASLLGTLAALAGLGVGGDALCAPALRTLLAALIARYEALGELVAGGSSGSQDFGGSALLSAARDLDADLHATYIDLVRGVANGEAPVANDTIIAAVVASWLAKELVENACALEEAAQPPADVRARKDVEEEEGGEGSALLNV